MTGFSGVWCLNAVVWEVEDLCHTVPVDGPIVGVMGKRSCATAVIETLQVVFFLYISPLHAVRIENMELTENIFLHCSSQRETLQREGWKRFSPTLFFVFSATSSPVLVLPLNMRVAQGENGNVHKIHFFCYRLKTPLSVASKPIQMEGDVDQYHEKLLCISVYSN